MNEDHAVEPVEEYCHDCGCIADDEICPRCRSEIADAQRRAGVFGVYRGDRRWNGQIMSHRRAEPEWTVLVDIREKP